MVDFRTRQDARREQMLRELSSDLADLVESGDLTEEQANEWYNDKADQWGRE
jgi:polyhydroxyalkanoate synthesis regulator phasin